MEVGHQSPGGLRVVSGSASGCQEPNSARKLPRYLSKAQFGPGPAVLTEFDCKRPKLHVYFWIEDVFCSSFSVHVVFIGLAISQHTGLNHPSHVSSSIGRFRVIHSVSVPYVTENMASLQGSLQWLAPTDTMIASFTHTFCSIPVRTLVDIP